MPFSAEDKANAERLILIACIITQKDLAAKLAVDGPYIEDLAKAIYLGTETNPKIQFECEYLTEEGSEGLDAIDRLRSTKLSVLEVASVLGDAYYSDPDSHSGLMNKLLELIRAQ